MERIDLAGLGEILGVLILLAAAQTAVLEQIFDTPFYQKWFGWGEDGKGSRLFKTFELRPWISNAVGIYICWLKDIQFPGDAVKSIQPHPYDVLAGIVFAGFIVGGGTKLIKKMMKDASDTAKEVRAEVQELK